MAGNGVNEFSGKTLDQFIKNGVIVRSNTIPITLVYKEDGVAQPITGFELWVTISSAIDSSDGSTILLEKQIPIADATTGLFSGTITDDETFALLLGTTYVSLKLIDSSGQSFIIDMAKYKVLDCANPKRDIV